MEGRENLELSQKERPAATAGVGKAGRAGQDNTRESAGPGQTMQSLLGSWSGAGFILNVVSSHQRGITI